MPVVKKYYHDIDLDNNQLISAVIENRTSAPATAVDGQVYYNTVDKKIYVYNATLSIWQELGGGGGIGTVTSVAFSVPTGFSVSGSPVTSSGTIGLTFAAGYALPTTASQTNWDTAYTNRITSLTTTGSSGSATLISNVLNIPVYTLAGLGGQPLATNLTSLSGLSYVSASFVKMTGAGTFTLDTNTYYLASNPNGYTNNTGTVTTVSVVSANGFAGTVATATSTPAITLTTTITGVLKGNGTAISAAVANTDYQSPITLTVTGSSGAATFNGTTLNIPTYTLAGLGGLTNPMTTLGDTIYGGVSGAVTRLAGNITTTKQYLSQTGTSTVSAAPAWSAIAGADVTGAALTKTDDTNVTLTLGGTPTTALLRAASLTLGWTGQLAVGRGGTGASTLTGVVIGNGASAMTAVSSSTALQVLRVNSGGTGYEFATISGGSLTDGDKGDITVSASGATWTIDNQAVTYAKIQNVTDARLLGRSAGSAGSVQEISIGSGLSLSGGILSSVAGGGSVTTVSVVSANGFAGTVANASSTPAITLSTTVTGLLKGNGTAISAAVANTDYLPVDDPLYTGTLSTGSLSFGPQAANPLMALESAVNSYNQSLIQNSSAGTQASSDIIVNNDQSTDTTFYGDYGINSSNYTGSGSISLPNAVYLYSAGGDLVLGTLNANDIHFFTDGSTTDSMLIKSTKQIQFNGYTSLTSFTGTLVGYLGFDSSGNIITTDPPAYSVISVSTTHNETATSGTKIIKADTTAGAFTINLPTAASNKATIIIKKVAGTPDLTVDAQASQTIDGGLTAILRRVDESITLVSDNSNWQIV